MQHQITKVEISIPKKQGSRVYDLTSNQPNPSTPSAEQSATSLLHINDGQTNHKVSDYKSPEVRKPITLSYTPGASYPTRLTSLSIDDGLAYTKASALSSWNLPVLASHPRETSRGATQAPNHLTPTATLVHDSKIESHEKPVEIQNTASARLKTHIQSYNPHYNPHATQETKTQVRHGSVDSKAKSVISRPCQRDWCIHTKSSYTRRPVLITESTLSRFKDSPITPKIEPPIIQSITSVVERPSVSATAFSTSQTIDIQSAQSIIPESSVVASVTLAEPAPIPSTVANIDSTQGTQTLSATEATPGCACPSTHGIVPSASSIGSNPDGSASSRSANSASVGIISGGVAGGGLLLFIAFIWARRRKRSRNVSNDIGALRAASLEADSVSRASPSIYSRPTIAF